MSLLDIFKPKRFALPVEASRYHYCGVGINAYPGNELKLCVNDIKETVAFWQNWSLPSGNITTLFDHDADKQNMEQAYTAAVERANPYDIVALQYSGHGSNLPCANERDGKMEIICPWNIRENFDENNVADPFFAALGRKATAKRVTLYMFPFDSCHTAGLTRTLQGRNTIAPPGVRYLEAPSEARYRGVVERTFKDDGIETSALAMLGGCGAEEYSYEYSEAQHGACTWALLEAFKQNKQHTLRSLHSFVAKKVTKAFPAQHPVLEGNPNLFDKPLFSPLFQK